MTTTPERARRRQAALTRDAIAAIVRAAIDEALVAQRRQDSVRGYDLESWLADITRRKTGELDLCSTTPWRSRASTRRGRRWSPSSRSRTARRATSKTSTITTARRWSRNSRACSPGPRATREPGSSFPAQGGTRAWTWPRPHIRAARSTPGTGGTATRSHQWPPRPRWRG